MVWVVHILWFYLAQIVVWAPDRGLPRALPANILIDCVFMHLLIAHILLQVPIWFRPALSRQEINCGSFIFLDFDQGGRPKMLAPRVPKIARAAKRPLYLVLFAALARKVCGRYAGVCFSPL